MRKADLGVAMAVGGCMHATTIPYRKALYYPSSMHFPMHLSDEKRRIASQPRTTARRGRPSPIGLCEVAPFGLVRLGAPGRPSTQPAPAHGPSGRGKAPVRTRTMGDPGKRSRCSCDAGWGRPRRTPFVATLRNGEQSHKRRQRRGAPRCRSQGPAASRRTRTGKLTPNIFKPKKEMWEGAAPDVPRLIPG